MTRFLLLLVLGAACHEQPSPRPRADGWWVPTDLARASDHPLDPRVDARPDVGAAPSCRFVSPPGPSAKNPVTFKVAMPAAVARVAYLVDGMYAIGESSDAASGFALSYTFTKFGQRLVTARGLSATAAELVRCDRSVLVEAGVPDVPYFYQYANLLYPASTCQNTSLAMLLAYFGWKGKPDNITAAWGKDHAQGPAGLAEVFNDYAAKLGWTERLVAHTKGSLGDVKALLAVGKPVIVHGYFTAGHVVVVLAFTGNAYLVHDPAGKWNEQWKGGYPPPQTPTSGKAVAYARQPFEAAIATSDGTTPEPVWYHELR
jgi:hypothetical protein